MSGLKNKRTIGVIAAVVVAVAGGLWAAAGRFGASADEPPADPTVERLKKLPFNEMREAVRNEELTDEQRREVFQSRRREMEQQMQERMDEYFAAAPENREAVLDRHIDELVERINQWRAERERREKQEKDEGNREERRERPNWTRNREESKERMEGGNPDQEKQRMVYRTKMRERMQARGIEMGRGMRGPGGRGSGGRGGGGSGGGR